MSLVAAALWGGAVGLDATSCPQVMISRPLVSGAVTGLILGHPVEGLAVGVLLEIFSLVILPIGAARYPEAGTAAIAAATAYIDVSGPEPEPHLLLLAVTFGLVWERLTGASVVVVRRMNERLVAGVGAHASPDAADVQRRHLAAMLLDFLRGALVAAAGAFVGTVLLGVLEPLWGLGAGAALGILGVAGAAMIAAALPLFGGWSGRRIAFGLGVVCGCALLLTR